MKKKEEKNNLKKENKKVVKTDNKKTEKIKGNTSEIKTVIILVAIVAIVFGSFYLLSYALVGGFDKKEEETEEVSIQYEEIIAGTSFSMNTSKYIVVYYDMDGDDAGEVVNAISEYKAKPDSLKVYTVDLGDEINKYAIAKEGSNKNPGSSNELAINGTTIIRFRDKMVREYIEGTDKVVDYLSK